MTKLNRPKIIGTRNPLARPSSDTNDKRRFAWDRMMQSLRETTQEPKESAIEVFDFEKNWAKVVPHLHHPKVKAALAEAGFDLKQGPWSHFLCNYWLQELDRRAEEALKQRAVSEKRWNRILKQREPKPGTLDWYQCPYGAQWLAPFLRELGELMFPEYTWKTMTGVRHSVAYGTDQMGTIKIIFDILGFKLPAIEIIDWVTQKNLPQTELEYEKCQALLERGLVENSDMERLDRLRRQHGSEEPKPEETPTQVGHRIEGQAAFPA
jgi:hypothetical protein